MSSPKEARRVSASRLAAIDQCSMKFYLHEILGLPEKVWPRTSAGSASHSVLEALRRDKNRGYHDEVKKAQTIYAVPAIERLVRAWTHKTKMPPEIVADIDWMCLVGINHTNFLDEGATKRFDPEHEFRMTLANGAVIKGFIDRLAEHGETFIIHDYKTARDKHDRDEVEDSYQSLTYQLYVWKTFGKLAEVRYYFLRHPPSKRYPANHVMITMPATPEQLAGFELYLQHMWVVINHFGLQEANAHFCADEGFCDRVCSYRRPFRYMLVTKADGSTEKYWIDPKKVDLPYQVKQDEKSEILSHPGCSRFNRQ